MGRVKEHRLGRAAMMRRTGEDRGDCVVRVVPDNRHGGTSEPRQPPRVVIAGHVRGDGDICGGSGSNGRPRGESAELPSGVAPCLRFERSWRHFLTSCRPSSNELHSLNLGIWRAAIQEWKRWSAAGRPEREKGGRNFSKVTQPIPTTSVHSAIFIIISSFKILLLFTLPSGNFPIRLEPLRKV